MQLETSERSYKRCCPHCQGRVESKGIRSGRRRYRCCKCKTNLGSVPLTEKEILALEAKDSGIGDLSLVEREIEILGLNRKVCLTTKPRRPVEQPYCLLPEYDPKWQDKISKYPQWVKKNQSGR